MSQSTTTNLGFLLDDFRDRNPGVIHALGVSPDGLLVAASTGVPDDRADQLAAVASGLVSLLAGAARCLQAGQVKSNMTELDAGFLLTMSFHTGASLMVLVAKDSDLGQASYEMGLLIERVGPALIPPPRLHSPAPLAAPAVRPTVPLAAPAPSA